MIIDVRQSESWAKYLAALGWISYRTSKNINIEIKPTFMGSFVKVQKPAAFDLSDLKEIEQICKEHKAVFIKIEPYIGQNVELIDSAGYELSWFPMTPTATYFINLEKSVDELWANVSHSGKYRINRARREGAVVEFVKHPSKDRVEEFYEVLKATGSLKKFYVPPIKHILAQVEAFGDKGVIAFVYDKDHVVCGAKWCVGYGDNVLYVSGGTSGIGRQDHSGYELLWQSILYFKNEGYKTFDLEGKDDARFPSFTKRWGGFSHFKEKFGGEVIEFPIPRVKYIGLGFKFFHKYFGFSV